MSTKLFLGLISVLLDGVGYYPYFRDILKKQTKPHLYTWLIWIITQGTATVAMIYGGANFGAWPFITGTILVALVFVLSFKYGTKDITRSDTILLIFALLAVATWWLFNSPIISVAMVTIIDAVGFIPTIRKSYRDPRSETVFFWVTMSIIDILAILALEQYNFLTVTYSVMLVIGNGIVIATCLLRRRILSTKEIKLKRTIPQDVDKFIELEKSIGEIKIYSSMTDKNEALQEINNNIVYFILLNGEIVGSVMYEIKNSDHVYISGLVVGPKFQGRGIARRAMGLIMEELKDKKRIDLVTHPKNEIAIHIYKTLGFNIESQKENYFGDGEPRVVMAKNKNR